jgi:hypothetical protein
MGAYLDCRIINIGFAQRVAEVNYAFSPTRWIPIQQDVARHLCLPFGSHLFFLGAAGAFVRPGQRFDLSQHLLQFGVWIAVLSAGQGGRGRAGLAGW